MKYLIILGATLVLIFAGAAAWLFLPQGEAPQTGEEPATTSGIPNYQGSVSVGSTSSEEPIVEPVRQTSVPSIDGTTVQTNSFASSTTTQREEIGGEVVLVGARASATDPYRISYYEPLGLFSVLLLTEPLKETRAAAERDLLRILGISEIDACRLRYFVSLPQDVNPFYAGKDLGFSFCPGSIQF